MVVSCERGTPVWVVVEALWFGVWGLGSDVSGFGFRVWGLGFVF